MTIKWKLSLDGFNVKNQDSMSKFRDKKKGKCYRYLHIQTLYLSVHEIFHKNIIYRL